MSVLLFSGLTPDPLFSIRLDCSGFCTTSLLMDPRDLHEELIKRHAAAERDLFKNAPGHVQELHRKAKKLIREQKRKEWFNTYGKPQS